MSQSCSEPEPSPIFAQENLKHTEERRLSAALGAALFLLFFTRILAGTFWRRSFGENDNGDAPPTGKYANCHSSPR